MEYYQYTNSGRICALMLTYGCNLNCVYCFEKYKDATKKMSIETAKEIILSEFKAFYENNASGTLKIDFFGGEPLLQFPIIKEIIKWAIEERESNNPYFNINHEFSITTNGTLLDTKKRLWFEKNKEYISLILSVDGKPDMQTKNRGTQYQSLPIEFVHKTWPEQNFKMTVSRETLKDFADGVIFFHKKRYPVVGSLAVGVNWLDGDEKMYAKQLLKLSEYYLSNPQIKPIPLFTRIYAEFLTNSNNPLPYKNCGTGTTMVAYDVDGTPYPCHMFVPLVTGEKSDFSSIEFNNPESLIDETCHNCNYLKVCRTCYGFNYNQRGDVKKRDKSYCKMIAVEIPIISAFQIKYYVLKNKLSSLSDEDCATLKAAIKCYEKYKNFNIY